MLVICSRALFFSAEVRFFRDALEEIERVERGCVKQVDAVEECRESGIGRKRKPLVYGHADTQVACRAEWLMSKVTIIVITTRILSLGSG